MTARTYHYRPWIPPSASASASLISSSPHPPSSARVSPSPPASSPFAFSSPPLTATDSDASSELDDAAMHDDEDGLTSTGASSSSPSSPPRSPHHSTFPPSSSDAPHSVVVSASAASFSFFPFFTNVLDPDPVTRATAIADIRSSILSSLPPPTSDPSTPAPSSTSSPPPPSALLVTHFPSLLRLALEAPFKDVREGFIELLALIADRDERYAHVLPACSGATQLIPDHLLPSADDTSHATSTPDEEQSDENGASAYTSSALLSDLFLSSGRISHFDRLLAFHPSFYCKWADTLDFLMTDRAGPLLLPDRHYIALIGASRFPSPFFLSFHASLFLQCHGDPAWLTSIRHAPKHIQALSSLSTSLAYSPFSIHPSDLQRCLKEGGMSMSELVHAISILTTYHAASAFAAALQINEEVDLGPLVQRVRDSPTTSRGSSRRNSVAGGGDDAAAAAAAEGQEGEESVVVATRRDSKGELVSQAQFLRRVLSDGHLQAEEAAALKADDDLRPQIFPDIAIDELYGAHSPQQPPQQQPRLRDAGASPSLSCSPFTPSAERFFVDQSELLLGPSALMPSPSTPLFSSSSFTFQEHACMGLNRYYATDFASLLLCEMEHITSMTTHHIGKWTSTSLTLDTSPFRRALHLFVQRYFGIYRDDFAYRNISILLSQPLQLFITRTCEGNAMNSDEWELPGFELTEAEKVHIALITMEARRQAELLYALQAVVTLNE